MTPLLEDHIEVTRLLCDSAADFISAKASATTRPFNEAFTVDRAVWSEIATLGWLGLALPESHGGSGMGCFSAASLCRVMGEHLFAQPFVAAGLMPSSLLARLDPGTHADLIHSFVSGEQLLAFAWQERVGQALVEGSKCSITASKLSGEKRFVTGVHDSSDLFLTAMENDEPVIILCPAGSAGMSIDTQATGHGSYSTVRFDQVDIGRENIVLRGAAATAAANHCITLARIAISAQLSGIAAATLQRTQNYLAERSQFGRRLASFQTVAHRCVDRRIDNEMADNSWQHAAIEFDSQLSTASEVSTSPAAQFSAKARAGDAARIAGRMAVQLHGAMGFTEECDIGQYLRAALFYASYLGSPLSMRRLCASTFNGTQVEQSGGGNSGEGLAMSTFTGAADQDTPKSALTDPEFRLQFREFLNSHYPAEWRQDLHRPFRRLRGEQANDWLRTLHTHGWRAPAWPTSAGGMGLSFRQQLIYHEELERAGVARIIDLGDTQLGPILIKLGTVEQQDYYLPRMLNCEHVWCQGYSEPGAGSDLASLQMKAVEDGDHFILNGQKIWTTHANDATHIFTLVRTGQFEKRQQGISFLLVDMQTKGLTVRPINNLAGEDEFCEVFFDNVRVPKRNLVGEVHEGWAVAKALLGFERIWIGSPALAGKALELAEFLVAACELGDDAGVSDQLAQLQADLHDYRIWYANTCDAVDASGQPPGPEVSMLKIYASELLQRITEFSIEVAEERGGIVGDNRVADNLTDLHWQFMMSRPVTIFAGANEIQRDIVAKTVLGMPVK